MIKRVFKLAAGAAHRFSAVLRTIVFAALAHTMSDTPALAESHDCSFFDGKTVELIVPFNPGGGFDTYGRIIAKHMGPKLGAENMIVRNQPGAGGLLATNQTWIAQPDGLRIQLISVSGILAAELAGSPGVRFKSAEFSWIGRVTGEPDIVAVAPDGGIDTMEDIQAISAERKVRIGSSGIGDIDYVGAKLLTLMFDLSSDIIVGFSGASEVYASMARGELDMFISSYSMARQAQAVDSAKIKWLFDDKADPELSDIVPLGAFLTGDNLQLVRAHSDLIAGGRSLAGPPGIDAGRLTCLREAFDRTIEDPKLLAEANGMKRPVSPLSGAELNETISRLTSGVPQAYLDILVEAYKN